jgi:hypothetical protein
MLPAATTVPWDHDQGREGLKILNVHVASLISKRTTTRILLRGTKTEAMPHR